MPSFIDRRYELVQSLGHGGMGEVFIAFDRLKQERVALKRVLKHAGDSEHLHRLALTQEFRTLASLRHPNIISVLDYGFDDEGVPFLVMELIEGAQHLTTFAQGKPHEVQISLIIQLFQALVYLHQRNILHRDLKPGNVVVSPDGTVRLLDFGLAAYQNTAPRAEDSSLSGTLAYMAPEVLRDKHYSIASDLYAGGMMTAEVLGGAHPLAGMSIASRIGKILNEPVEVSLPDQPALEAVINKLLNTDPAERYASGYSAIEAFCDATHQPVPAETVAIRDSFLQASTFVGRDREMGILQAALEQSISGHGQLWLIGGESGIGKSRLLDEVRIHALIRGARVVRGQAPNGWQEPLRRLALEVDLTDLEAGVLKAIVPDIADLLGRSIPDPPPLQGQDHAANRLVDTVASLIGRQPKPVVILLEDLQWDSNGVALLKAISSLLRGKRVLISGNYRDDEAPDLPASLPDAHWMLLKRLDHTAIQSMTEAMLGGITDRPDLIEFLEKETEGNAFFMVEVMRALAEESGSLKQIMRSPLPVRVTTEGVKSIASRRLAQMPQADQAVLALLAVAGRMIDLHILEYLAPQPHKLLMDSAQVAVFSVQDGEWAFAHDKLREALLASIHPDELPKLHEQVALAIEAVYPESPTHIGALADHWLAAGDADQARYYAEQAGRRARRDSQFKIAVEYLRRALSLTPPAEQSELLLALADTLIPLSDYDEANNALNQTEALGGILSLVQRYEILRLRQEIMRYRGWYDRIPSVMDDALAIATTLNDPVRVAGAHELAGLAYCMSGNGEAGLARLEQAYALKAYFEDDPVEMANLLNNLGICQVTAGQFSEAEVNLKASQTLARQIGDVYLEANILTNLTVLSLIRFELDQALAYAEESLAIRRRINELWGISASLSNIGLICLHRGEFERGRVALKEALQLIRDRLDDNHSLMTTLANLGHIEREDGNWMSSLACYLEALDVAFQTSADNTALEILVGMIKLKPTLTERDIQYLGMIKHHPSADHSVSLELDSLLERAQAQFDPDEFTALIDSGRALNLQTVSEELKASLEA